MIKQTIIVEGADDIRAVKAAVDCHVIATGGTHFGRAKLAAIQKAYETTGIIVLTDPDYAGNKIRRRITNHCPNALHAYLPRRLADDSGHAGVEYASPEVIRHALDQVKTETVQEGTLTTADLMRLRLAGGEGALERRIFVAERLGIGAVAAKPFLKHVNHYGISFEELARIVEEGDNGQ